MGPTSRIPHPLVTVFPVKQYYEAQQEIILKYIIKIQLTPGRGELMDFNKYVFIMARYCNTDQNCLRPQVFWWVYCHPILILLLIPGLRPLHPSGWDWRPDPMDWAVVSGLHEAHYEHDTLIFHQFSITNFTLLLCGCMWTRMLGHIPKHPSRTIMTWLQTWHNNTTNIPVLSNSSCICSIVGEVGHMVYRWGFSCLDYPLDVLIR